MRITFIFLFLSTMLFSACDEDTHSPQIVGSGNIISEVRELDPFESIHISAVINGTITQGNSQEVSISADDNIIDLVTTEVRSGVLYIDLDGENFDDITIDTDITIPTLSAFTSVGVNTISINQFYQLDRLNVNVEGVGTLQMSGSSGELNITSSGATNINGFDFSATTCDINLSGVGNIQISVSDQLSGTISGVGNLLYKGSPSINVSVSGVGNIVDSN